MTVMRDYSGKLIGDLKYNKFSKPALKNLLELYGQFFRALDGFWYLAVKERFGNAAALACDIDVWRQICPYEMVRLSQVMQIQGSDVPAAMKAIQLNPWLQQTEFSMEIISEKRGILTVKQCPTLKTLEKEGAGREAEICNLVDPQIFLEYSKCVNPQIEVHALISPPRKDRTAICCQWEFTMP